MGLSIIYASTPDGIIGVDGKLPWSGLREDMSHFKALTMGKPVIMGRKTWESIGSNLPGRRNIVVSSRDFDGPDSICRTPLDAFAEGDSYTDPDIGDEFFVVGGASIYEAMIPRSERIYWTEVSDSHVAMSRDDLCRASVTRWSFDRTKWWQTGVCNGATPGVTFYRFDRRIA
jgi:dihydrofolate reductase